jgi:hypothetical protein
MKVVIADYKDGIEDNEVFNALQNMSDNTVQFCLQQLQLYQPGDDYQELLELTLIFLGVVTFRVSTSSSQALFIELPSWCD